MANFTLQAHLLLCAQRAKTFTNSKLLEFNEAVVDALEEMADAKADKIRSPTVDNVVSMDANGDIKDSGLSVMTIQEMKASISSILGVSL